MHIHILGICGTFMGGIALLARQQGHRVTGSDTNIYPPMSQQLMEQGIELFDGYESTQLQPMPDQIIVGNVMKRGMPVVEYILNEGLPYISGPAWLRENILHNRWVLAVSGTHGKTTTTSLLAWILESAGLNPSFLIGGVPENFGVSARLTDSPFFVIEADEYDSAFFDKRSKFIHYRPRTLIINNLEFDHADIFDNFSEIQKQFRYLVRTVPENGLIVAPSNEEAILEVFRQGCWTPVTYFSLSEKDHWYGQALSPDGSSFEVYKANQKQIQIDWNLIGAHNIHNALAALLAAQHVGVPLEQSGLAMSTFKNVKRRLEILGKINDVTVYDDFAHHPTAIATTIQGLRSKVGKERIIVVLELRSYTMRMGFHTQQLAGSLDEADKVIFLRPQEAPGIEAVLGSNQMMEDVDSIIEALIQMVKARDHVVIMSNGGFGNIHQKLLQGLESVSL
jgi:UDP-N-acetylmuramate: L-alanyl-gamma-D-glutamyl-meso-diaminopimelate ligase